mmetsp:Transcript_6164/g.9333  ORF Transcript_6164/g.9333 Transcript_6164/m.9333 type:complete len:81 (+) Transcript_6164:2177-2419(+)
MIWQNFILNGMPWISVSIVLYENCLLQMDYTQAIWDTIYLDSYSQRRFYRNGVTTDYLGEELRRFVNKRKLGRQNDKKTG